MLYTLFPALLLFYNFRELLLLTLLKNDDNNKLKINNLKGIYCN